MDLFCAEGKTQTSSLRELAVTLFPFPSKCPTWLGKKEIHPLRVSRNLNLKQLILFVETVKDNDIVYGRTLTFNVGLCTVTNRIFQNLAIQLVLVG